MRKIFVIFILILTSVKAFTQDPAGIVSSIFDDALTNRTAYNNLEYLCKNTKGRLAGSEASLRAVSFAKQALIDAGADTVWLQEVNVPFWERGTEKCKVYSRTGNSDLSITALGLSVGTSKKGIRTRIIEVDDVNDLKSIDKSLIKGRIVFFNKPADRRLINTFAAYSSTVAQRISWPSEASKYGAVAAIVRSITPELDDYPQTGVTHYTDGVVKIPAVAVSTVDAEMLSSKLKSDPDLEVYLLSTCVNHPDTKSYNVVGEIRGSSATHEYITVGGHLDSWDNTEGAHDDGGGCVQTIELVRLYKKLGIRPKRTIRAVLFMNEEMSSTGGKAYAEAARIKGEKHYAALESDRGVMSPRGFGFEAEGGRLEKLQALSSYFSPYFITDFEKGGGGSDIAPLKASGTMLIGYIPDAQRYFSYHHSAHDTFDQVNIRELQMGSAAIASLIYLIDLFDL